MEEKVKMTKPHSMSFDNRNKGKITGVNDVISFDLTTVLLETEQGMLTLKGDDLHVSRLSIDKGEVDIDGRIDKIEYSEIKGFGKKNDSLMHRLLK